MIGELKHKISNCKDCANGKHTFIPAVWSVSANKRVCEMFVCQHCMMPFDKTEREIMCQHHKCELEKHEESKNENP